MQTNSLPADELVGGQLTLGGDGRLFLLCLHFSSFVPFFAMFSFCVKEASMNSFLVLKHNSRALRRANDTDYGADGNGSSVYLRDPEGNVLDRHTGIA
jgi:hypothetical protein